MCFVLRLFIFFCGLSLSVRLKQPSLRSPDGTCQPCPISSSGPVCGSDGHNYASQVNPTNTHTTQLHLPPNPHPQTPKSICLLIVFQRETWREGIFASNRVHTSMAALCFLRLHAQLSVGLERRSLEGRESPEMHKYRETWWMAPRGIEKQRVAVTPSHVFIDLSFVFKVRTCDLVEM